MGKHAASQTLPVEALGKNATSTPTRRELFGALFGSFAVNRTRCIIGKAAVSVEISYFEHIFIIIYSYIPLCTILYIPFPYFYNYIFFHVSNILSIFTTKLRLRCLFSPYIVFQKYLLQLKFNMVIFLQHCSSDTCDVARAPY